MTEHDVLMWLFPVLGSILSLIGLGIFNQLKDLAGSVKELSVDMAVIAEKVNSHEERIRSLENKKSNVGP